jgi:hypothetical protein
VRAVRGHTAERLRAQSHGERARYLAGRDLGALEACAVLSSKGFECIARIEPGDASGLKLLLGAAMCAAERIF